VGITLSAVLGASLYVAYQFQQSLTRDGTLSSIKTMRISGNSLTETIPINTYTVVDIYCNSCRLTFQLSGPQVRADFDFPGNNSYLTVNGGKTDVAISGNDNFIDLHHSMVLSVLDFGKNNTIAK